MKVSEIIFETPEAYLNSLGTRLSNMNIDDAIARGFQDSRIRSKAKEWLGKWNEKLSQLKSLPNQTVLTKMLQYLTYSDMRVAPSNISDKAIQQLVDLTSTNQSDTNIALKYMTKLMTLSLIEPSQEKQQIEYGGYLPDNMLHTGSIVPVKYVLANDDSTWVKFNGDWYKDIDNSEHQVKLNYEPAIDSYDKLENMRGRNVPMRVGQTGTRTLEFLRRDETQEWFSDHE